MATETERWQRALVRLHELGVHEAPDGRPLETKTPDYLEHLLQAKESEKEETR